MALKRFMFVNHGDDVTVSITARENVGVFEMQPFGDAVEKLVETHPLNGSPSATWDLRLAAGGICGFCAYGDVDYRNPDPEHLAIVTAKDKDEWPEPPPPLLQLSRWAGAADFGERYGRFLTSKGSPARESRG